ncbi:GNAT family N-acetyltransferase [Cryptosporangium sp. NPDC048952]|uniref:GNAT family N-acetyltransferase n=1 Tax=Cryptosporangium sp. NPDC048952 TaxID=3363961 RepID=UPI003721B4DD
MDFREATADDVPQLTAMIRARGEWMTARNIRGGEGWSRRADSLARQAADPTFPVWVLVDGNRVVGCTSFYDAVPAWLWTDEADRAEPSIFLATSVTDPDYAGRRLACLMAWSALDLADRRGQKWVRRGTGPDPGLVRYYSEVQRFDLVRTGDFHGDTGYGLQRRAARQPHLAEWLAAGAVPAGAMPAGPG